MQHDQRMLTHNVNQLIWNVQQLSE